jgi:hypothetical protein
MVGASDQRGVGSSPTDTAFRCTISRTETHMHGYSKIEARSFALGRLYERITAEITDTAKEIAGSEQDLTTQLGALLLLGTEGSAQDSLRVHEHMRLQAPVVDQGVRKVARRGRPRKSSSRPTEGVGQGGYWKSMTPEQRQAEMRRRMAKRKVA